MYAPLLPISCILLKIRDIDGTASARQNSPKRIIIVMLKAFIVPENAVREKTSKPASAIMIIALGNTPSQNSLRDERPAKSSPRLKNNLNALFTVMYILLTKMPSRILCVEFFLYRNAPFFIFCYFVPYNNARCFVWRRKMKIEIIDDGVGAFATLNKIRHGLCADYYVQILDEHFPLGYLRRQELLCMASKAIDGAVSRGAEAVVLSSIALSMAAAKTLALNYETPLFGCEAPIIHAGTYTASKVLAVGDAYVFQAAKRLPNVIALNLPDFASMAETGASEREIVGYIAQNAEKYSGSFDCIALGCSSMNLYKHCFSRVFPNAQIFDSLEGVARKLRKKYRKNSRDESTVTVFNEKMQDLSQKYNFFIDEFQTTY